MKKEDTLEKHKRSFWMLWVGMPLIAYIVLYGLLQSHKSESIFIAIYLYNKKEKKKKLCCSVLWLRVLEGGRWIVFAIVNGRIYI